MESFNKLIVIDIQKDRGARLSFCPILYELEYDSFYIKCCFFVPFFFYVRYGMVNGSAAAQYFETIKEIEVDFYRLVLYVDCSFYIPVLAQVQ